MERYCNDDKHNAVIDRLDRNEKRLNNHSERIDKLEQESRVLVTELKHLTHSVGMLTKTIWGTGGIVLVYVLNKILNGVV